MSCCSGSTQTRKISVLIIFQPTLEQQFRLKVALQGRNGVWKGKDTGNFDFGAGIGCGNKQRLGVQDVSAKIQLNCTDTDNPLIAGTLSIEVAKTIFNHTLPAIPLECVKGGPNCSCTWSSVFLGQYLGNATISISGTKA